jgi:hypothetical protein
MAFATLRQSISRFIEKHPWRPLVFFVGVPAVLVGFFYLVPKPWAWGLCLVLGALIFALLLAFMFLFRREESAALGTSIPTIFGPIITYFFVQHRARGELWDILQNRGGDRLIQLAFLFAGIVALLIYHLTILREMGQDTSGTSTTGRRPNSVYCATGSFAVVVIILGTMAMSGDFAPQASSIATAFGVESPAFTPLTLCRMMLSLWSVFLATMPRLSNVSSSPAPEHPTMTAAT